MPPRKPSQVGLANSSDELFAATKAPVIEAFGDPDDHLRIATLVSLVLRHNNEDAKRTAANPKASWVERRNAFEEALREAEPVDDFVGVLVDPDALSERFSKPVDCWADVRNVRERSEVLHALVGAVERGGWLVLRPQPRPELTSRLRSLEVSAPRVLTDWGSDDDSQLLGQVAGSLQPSLVPFLRWLAGPGGMKPRPLLRLLEGTSPESMPTVVLETAYDRMKPSLRLVAHRVAVVRGEQPLNGVAGPFRLVDQIVSAEELPRVAFEQLSLQGWILPSKDRRTFRVNPIARRFLLLRALLADPDGIRRSHHWIGSSKSKKTGEAAVRADVDRHYHAVESEDLELAVRSAKHYGNDLRQIGFLKSRERRFADAANVYRVIVASFDEKDSYAWEYLGFNLARQMRGRVSPESSSAQEAEAAYKRACDLEPQNPLYRGRLLGFRARQGIDVSAEFAHWLACFGIQSDYESVSFFAEPVLDGLRSAGRREEMKNILKAWPYEARRSPRLAKFLGY